MLRNGIYIVFLSLLSLEMWAGEFYLHVENNKNVTISEVSSAVGSELVTQTGRIERSLQLVVITLNTENEENALAGKQISVSTEHKIVVGKIINDKEKLVTLLNVDDFLKLPSHYVIVEVAPAAALENIKLPIEKLLSRKVEAKKVFEWWKIPVVRERINVYGLKELLKHRLHIENRHIFLAVELPEGMQFAVATVPPEAKPTEFYALVESKPGITMGAIASALGKIEGMLYVDVHNIYVTEEGKIRVPFSSSSDQQTLSVHDTITVRDNIHLNIKIEKN